MRRTHRLLLAGLPLAWAGLSATDARACSMSDFPAVRVPGGVHMIATATADTLLSGPGSVRFRGESAQSGPAGERIHGQVVEVERAGGLARGRLPGRFTRAVLVPWGYGADCAPTPWSDSARWVEPGRRGLFSAMLRDSAQWVDGIPTFDVFAAYSKPYPRRPPASTPGGAERDSSLTADEAFGLMDVLPVLDAEDEAEAARPLFAWARANPALARRRPAASTLAMARYSIEYDLLQKIDPPLAGTYRFTATLAGRPPLTFFARTHSTPVTAWSPRPEPPEPADPTELRRPRGYTMMVGGASAVDSLPVSGRGGREGYFSVLAEPERRADGAQVWLGSIDINLIVSQFPADSVIRQFAKDDFERYYEASRKELPEEMRARFVLAPDGSVRAEQITDLGGGRVMTIRAERISRQAIRPPR